MNNIKHRILKAEFYALYYCHCAITRLALAISGKINKIYDELMEGER